MNRTMTHKALVVVFGTALLTGMTLAARADDSCSTARAAGNWGFTLTGTLVLQAGAVPVAAVGTLTADAAGNISGKEARSVGGDFANETITGSWTVNSDCTGTLTAYVYESNVLTRTSVASLVVVDNMREIRMVQQSLTLPGGGTLQVVITLDGKRLFPQNASPQ